MKYYSQAGQDKWVHELIGNSGFFVDVGAYDGIQTSNTYALEILGWEGICIEPNYDIFKILSWNRKCGLSNKVVTNYSGIIGFENDHIGGENHIECDTLNNILQRLNCPKKIDYLSLDIEGHELTVLSCFDFERWQPKLLTVEHNLYCDGLGKKNALFKLLTEKGYTRVVEDVKCLDPNPLYFNQPFEDWYAKDIIYNR